MCTTIKRPKKEWNSREVTLRGYRISRHEQQGRQEDASPRQNVIHNPIHLSLAI